MKKLIITSCIVLAVGLVLSVIGVYAGAFEPIEQEKYTEEFSPYELSSIFIDNCYDDIAVTVGSSDFVKVSYSCDAKRQNNVTVENGILKINTTTDYRWYDYIWNINAVSRTISVELPQNQNSHIDVSINNSNASFMNINGSMDINCTNGNISLYSCVLSELSAECSSGNILISKTAVTDVEGDIAINNKSGNIRIQNSRMMKLVLDSKYGNITISDCDLDALTADTDSGNIHINTADIAKSADIKCKYGNTALSRLVCPVFTAESQNGNIDFSELTSDTINLNSTYGSIRGKINGIQAEYTIMSNANYGTNNLKNAVGTSDKTLTAENQYGSITISFSN